MDQCNINLNIYKLNDAPNTIFFKNNIILFEKTQQMLKEYTRINQTILFLLTNELRINTNLTANTIQNFLLQELKFFK